MSRLDPNPWRGKGLEALGHMPSPSRDAGAVADLLGSCPAHAPTPLVDPPELARRAGVAACLVKDESSRMKLGSFKALGAAYAIARKASDRADPPGPQTLRGETFVAASAGNHGLSVAAGARLFGAHAVIYLANTVPEAFAQRLRATGAMVVRAGDDYEASMTQALADAAREGWTVLSDTSWEGYTELPFLIMEGYLQMVAEALEAAGPVSHVFLQAGVGGLAAAVTALVRARLGDDPVIVVVEPEAAPAVHASLLAGKAVHAPGPVSSMGRLDCKEPSLIALKELAREADFALTITEDEAAQAVDLLGGLGLDSTPSGAAGIAGLLSLDTSARRTLGLDQEARVLTFLSEGPEG